MNKFIAQYNYRPNITTKGKRNLDGTLKTNKIPTGVIIAMRDDKGKVQFGWSSCARTDVFKKKRAIEIATERIVKKKLRPVPSSLSNVLIGTQFLNRCESYFNEAVEAPKFFIMENGKKELAKVSDEDGGYTILEY